MPSGRLVQEGPVAAAQMATVVHAGGNEALDRYIEEHAADLQRELDQERRLAAVPHRIGVGGPQ